MDYLGGSQPYDTASPSPTSYLLPGTKGTRFTGRRPAARARLRTITIVQPKAQRRNESATVKAKFRSLVREWRAANQMESSPVAMAMHPSYQRIIALGAPVLPLVIEELRSRGGHWFWALRFLADHDPVPQAARGDYNQMRELWLDWWDRNSPK